MPDFEYSHPMIWSTTQTTDPFGGRQTVSRKALFHPHESLYMRIRGRPHLGPPRDASGYERAVERVVERHCPHERTFRIARFEFRVRLYKRPTPRSRIRLHQWMSNA